MIFSPFVMSSIKYDDNSLPMGWIVCESKSTPGKKYYFNKKTGKSSWTKPQVQETPCSSKKKKTEPLPNGTVEIKNEGDRPTLKRKHNDTSQDSNPKRRNPSETQPDNCRNNDYRHNEKSPANARMAVLRTKLADEAEREERLNRNHVNTESPTKCCMARKRRASQEEKKSIDNKTMKQTRESVGTAQRKARTSLSEHKSPKSSDTMNCAGTVNSPSGDGHAAQGSPPSQFYTASKILTSMKAQLSECSYNAKPKDTFSFIEEGICNQTPEYPPTKHPSTPPQFSEVSKIVSAMKSRLSGKSLPKDDKVPKQYKSMNERLQAYRTSLREDTDTDIKKEDVNKESIDIIPHKNNKKYYDDDVMEVEYKEVVYKHSPSNDPKANASIDEVRNNLILVVDTNVFIQEIDVIKKVVNSRIKGYDSQPTLVVPWRVINELDRLKDNNNGNGPVCKRARAAMDYLYQSLPKNNRIKGQTLRDANSHIYPCESPDDEILNCCLQQAERGRTVLLLSNDKNFRSKATINTIRSMNISELKQSLEEGPRTSADAGLPESMKYYESCIYDLLSNILENEMRAKYNSLWQHVLLKAPPWSLLDVLQCLLKHWIAVFNEVFPRIQHLIQELNTVLQRIVQIGLSKISQADVTCFKELASEVATKCIIIPEYMELAKLTVERLSRGPRGEPPRAPAAGDATPVHLRDTDEKMVVIDAFENVWSVFSSYCAKLASLVGVTHDLEDKVCSDESLTDLTAKWTMFSNQIYAFTFAIKGVLSEPNESHPHFEEQLVYLVSIFRESLELIPQDSGIINRHNMRAFCLHSRELLRAAYTKFSQLTQLLDQCRNRMSMVSYIMTALGRHDLSSLLSGNVLIVIQKNMVEGQTLRDANSHIYPCESPDDETLNCCLQQAERGRTVLLLSNDKNFRSKATINTIRSMNISELKQSLEEGPRTSADAGLPESMKYYESCIYDLLSNILENEMRAKYNSLWQHVLLKAPPWSLLDVLQCLLKHWIAVFNEVFPRIQHLIQELNTVLQRIVQIGLSKISQADVTCFKELASEVATKCIIIPEYMELAKLTVERLSRGPRGEPPRAPAAGDATPVHLRDTDEKMVVIDAFENVWSVFSSYCAKLASLVGVTHDLEDKVCSDESLTDLTAKWTMFSNQIYAFTFAIKGVLSEPNESHPHFEEQLVYLVSIFRESLELIPQDSGIINRHNMRAFCLHSRELLRAAYTKFSQLTQLLDQCRNRMVSQ